MVRKEVSIMTIFIKFMAIFVNGIYVFNDFFVSCNGC